MLDQTPRSITDDAGTSCPGTVAAREGASGRPRLRLVMDPWSRAIVEWHVVIDDAATAAA